MELSAPRSRVDRRRQEGPALREGRRPLCTRRSDNRGSLLLALLVPDLRRGPERGAPSPPSPGLTRAPQVRRPPLHRVTQKPCHTRERHPEDRAAQAPPFLLLLSPASRTDPSTPGKAARFSNDGPGVGEGREARGPPQNAGELKMGRRRAPKARAIKHTHSCNATPARSVPPRPL